MTVLITLTQTGADTGPFDLFSDLDGYIFPFATAVPKSSLIAGYTSAFVPDYSNFIRVKSVGNCTTYIDIPVTGIVTTTSSTTVLPDPCITYRYPASSIDSNSVIVEYIDCFDLLSKQISIPPNGEAVTICAKSITSHTGNADPEILGTC